MKPVKHLRVEAMSTNSTNLVIIGHINKPQNNQRQKLLVFGVDCYLHTMQY